MQFVGEQESRCATVLCAGVRRDAFEKRSVTDMHQLVATISNADCTGDGRMRANDAARLGESEPGLFAIFRGGNHFAAGDALRADRMKQRERCGDSGFPVSPRQQQHDGLYDARSVRMARAIDAPHDAL